MKRVQEEFGSDRLGVVMLDTTNEDIDRLTRTNDRVTSFFSRFETKVDWPCAVVPNGTETIARKLNKTGYGLLLVDPKGNVVDADLHVEELRSVMQRVAAGGENTNPSAKK